MTTRGYFIVLEGGDGSGKSTQAALLAGALRTRRPDPAVLATREPGGTALGLAVRDLVLHGDDVDPRAEALLYAADRAQHVYDVIRPALDAGQVVICDRYVDSSIAYQAEGRALGAADVRAVNDFATGGLRPDLVVLLDLDPDLAVVRTAGEKPDRLERAGADFHRRVRAHYLELAGADPERYVTIRAEGSVDEVHTEVLRAVLDRLSTPAAELGTGATS